LSLIAAVLLFSYSIAVAVWLWWPGSLIVVAAVGFSAFVRRPRRRSTALGSARFAEKRDLYRAGMLGADSGLPLGRLPAGSGRQNALSVRPLFDLRVDSVQACREIWPGYHRGEIVRLSQSVHIAIFSRTGGGKTVSCVIPMCFTCRDSIVVNDPKGEVFLKSAQHRKKRFRNKIVPLDPYHVVTQTPATYNPIDFISAEDPQAIEHCRTLANAMVVRSPDEREPHWADSAVMWITAFIAVVVVYGKRGDNRSLLTVNEFLSREDKRNLALRLMCETECWGGSLADMGGQLLSCPEKERGSVLTTVARHTQFLSSPSVKNSVRTSSFDPKELHTGKCSVFLILPPLYQDSMAGLTRLWIGSLMRSLMSGGAQE
jgi:type IV secretion system protein VirD4